MDRKQWLAGWCSQAVPLAKVEKHAFNLLLHITINFSCGRKRRCFRKLAITRLAQYILICCDIPLGQLLSQKKFR